MKTLFILPIIFFLIISCQQEKPNPPKSNPVLTVNIKLDSVYQEKHYTLKDSTGDYKFTVYLNDLNRGIIGYNYKGLSAIPQQTKPMYTLLKTIFQDSLLNFKIHTLVWGRLFKPANNDLLMSKRLALAATKSNAWNKKTGKPFAGHENAFVLNLANSAQIFPELRDLFNLLEYNIKVSGVEKVIIQTAAQLPFWDEISGKTHKNDKLPFDCQTWFSIEKAKN
jgi:hypothetical protein